MKELAVVRSAQSVAIPNFTLRTIPRQFRNDMPQRGQGMTEYIVIVALIAVAAIGVYQYFGQVVRSQTAGIANEVAGQTGTTAIAVATAAASSANGETGKKGLATYSGAADAGAAGAAGAAGGGAPAAGR